MAEEKDPFDYVVGIATIVGAVAIPVIILCIGLTFQTSQHNATLKLQEAIEEQNKLVRSQAEERQKAERLMPFITHLTSSNQNEIKVASNLFSYFNEKKLLPEDSAPLFIVVASADNDSISKVGQDLIVKANKDDKNLGKNIGEALDKADEETQDKIIKAAGENKELNVTLREIVPENSKVKVKLK